MKKKIGVIGGGPSVEHEISLQSAKNVWNVIDPMVYEKVFIGITKKNQWFYLDTANFDQLFSKGELFCLDDHPKVFQGKCLLDTLKSKIDIAFPVVHGNLGEDGAIQGLFKCLDIPCVGPGILDAALTMDKELLKRVMMEKGLRVVPFITVIKSDIDPDFVEKKLGMPVFVKPCNSGSSLGITKVKSKEFLQKALEEAFQYDKKVLIEKAIEDCREIECSVLGNAMIKVSCPGEVVCHHEFYSYQAKYLDENGASLSIPAHLSDKQIQEVQELARQAYQASCCHGMARVDFFLDAEGVFYLNEINSVPGFTKISLYPKLWEWEGVSQQDLVKKLIDLGFEKYNLERKLKNNYEIDHVLI